jgi:hypothetical protein
MAEPFKIGDHVRLKTAQRHPGLIPGDTGTVTGTIPSADPADPHSYHVRLNRTTAGLFATFAAEELELLK